MVDNKEVIIDATRQGFVSAIQIQTTSKENHENI